MTLLLNFSIITTRSACFLPSLVKHKDHTEAQEHLYIIHLMNFHALSSPRNSGVYITLLLFTTSA